MSNGPFGVLVFKRFANPFDNSDFPIPIKTSDAVFCAASSTCKGKFRESKPCCVDGQLDAFSFSSSVAVDMR